MLRILDNDATYLNIVWCDPRTGDLETVQIGELMARSAPMGLMALNLSAMVATVCELSTADFIVVVQHHPETGAGFCLCPAQELEGGEERAVSEALQDFFVEFAVHCDGAAGLETIDTEYCNVNFRSARALMRVMESYYNDSEILVTPADLQIYGDEDEEKLIQKIGAECLRDAWVFAVMNETMQGRMEDVHRAAHRTGMANLPCDFGVIEQAVEKAEQRGEKSAKKDRQMMDYNPNGLRYH